MSNSLSVLASHLYSCIIKPFNRLSLKWIEMLSFDYFEHGVLIIFLLDSANKMFFHVVVCYLIFNLSQLSWLQYYNTSLASVR